MFQIAGLPTITIAPPTSGSPPAPVALASGTSEFALALTALVAAQPAPTGAGAVPAAPPILLPDAPATPEAPARQDLAGEGSDLPEDAGKREAAPGEEMAQDAELAWLPMPAAVPQVAAAERIELPAALVDRLARSSAAPVAPAGAPAPAAARGEDDPGDDLAEVASPVELANPDRPTASLLPMLVPPPAGPVAPAEETEVAPAAAPVRAEPVAPSIATPASAASAEVRELGVGTTVESTRPTDSSPAPAVGQTEPVAPAHAGRPKPSADPAAATPAQVMPSSRVPARVPEAASPLPAGATDLAVRQVVPPLAAEPVRPDQPQPGAELAEPTRHASVAARQTSLGPVAQPVRAKAPGSVAAPVSVATAAPMASIAQTPSPAPATVAPAAPLRIDLPAEPARHAAIIATPAVRPGSLPGPVLTQPVLRGAALHAAALANLPELAPLAPTSRRIAVDPAAVATLSAPGLDAAAPLPATTEVAQPPLDMAGDDWMTAMIERIETVRDTMGARETRIRLIPDALGAVDIEIRQEGDRLHVRINAETPSARAMIAEAAPKLADLAEQRGLRLGQTSVDLGAGAHGQRERGAQQNESRLPAAPPSATGGAEPEATDDHRIA